MKKIFITTLITIFLISTIFAQKKQNINEMYIGNKIGLSQYNDLEKINKKFQNINEYNNELGTGLFIGYRTSKNLSFELGYDWLGKVEEKKKFSTTYFKAQGINFISKINLPINRNIDLYTRLGGIIINSVYNEKNEIKKYQKDFINTKLSPLISVGIEYKINPDLLSRIDYQFIYSIGDKNFLKEEPNNNFLNISFIYKYKKNNIKINNNSKRKINFNIKFNKNESIINNLSKNKLNLFLEKIFFLNKNIYKIKIINYIFHKENKFNKLQLVYNRINNIEKYFLGKGINFIKLNKKIYDFTNFENNKKIFNNINDNISIIKIII